MPDPWRAKSILMSGGLLDPTHLALTTPYQRRIRFTFVYFVPTSLPRVDEMNVARGGGDDKLLSVRREGVMAGDDL